MSADIEQSSISNQSRSKYLLNSWYCVGWSRDLVDEPVGITVCEKYIAVYRDASGSVAALDGRCPHRFAPLDQGIVDGDTLVCPYHGLVFNKNGQCILNPHGEGIIPPRAHIRSYPALEHLGAVWVWPGEADLADPSKLPQLEWPVSEKYSTVRGYLKVNANYQLVMDNLLDLTHAQFLHQDTVGGKPEDSVGLQHSWNSEPGPILHSDYFIANQPHPSPQIAALMGDVPGDMHANMTWRPACILDLDIGYSPTGDNQGGDLHIPSLHFLAPESDNATHYFFALARNVDIHNKALDELTSRMVHQAFAEEDEPMIRACAKLMDDPTDLLSHNPAILQTDAAGVAARRLLKKEIAGSAG